MTTWITICDTCKKEDWDVASGKTDGEILAGLIEAQSAHIPEIRTRRVSCMMGCKRACNVAIQGDAKLAYVLGQFNPEPGDADAIIGYAQVYNASETGQVPYRQWPEGVKGHFTSRTQPVPQD